MQQWKVRAPERLIDFIQSQLAGSLSNKAIRRALDRNACRVNGKVERFASRGVAPGDQVLFSHSSEPKAAWDFPILFEDEWIRVIDKPAGWVCEDGALHRLYGSCYHLVHRLDKETSGILLLAKQPQIRDDLIALFAKREVDKVYLALADDAYSGGPLVKTSYFVRKKSFAGQTIWGSAPVGGRGLYARTQIEPVATSSTATLFACRPETGRTHQIRVHLAELGHPILIDRQYAAAFRSPYAFSRPLLHALRLTFTHPITKEIVDLHSFLPRDMRSAIDLVGFPSGHVGQFLMKQGQKERWNKGDQNEKAEESLQAPCSVDEPR